MHHFTIVLPTGHQHFTTEGRYITGANVQTCAVNAEAARLAVFTLAGEADAVIVRGMRWAASMIFYMLRQRQPNIPPTAHTAALRMQYHMMQVTGQTNPNRAHDVLMAEWLAKHPNPTTKPAPQPRPFAPVPNHQSQPATSDCKPRHILTIEDRRKAGRATASKPAPTGRACPYCRQSSTGFSSHLAFAGHIGFCAFARKYANGDKKLAGDMLSRKGLAVIDPVPSNGAWQRGANLAA